MAFVTGADSIMVAGAAIAFVIARLLHSVFYILNVPLARSLMFGISIACVITLMTASFLQVNPG